MKRILAITILFILAAMLRAEVSNPSMVTVTSAPSGSCSASLPQQYVNTTGDTWSCQNVSGAMGTWTKLGGGGGYQPDAVSIMAAPFNAKCDFQTTLFSDGAMVSGSAHLTSASNPFVAGDVGKTVWVRQAGVGSTSATGTISAFNSAGDVTLSFTNLSGGDITGQGFWYATDDSTAINACWAAGNCYIPVFATAPYYRECLIGTTGIQQHGTHSFYGNTNYLEYIGSANAIAFDESDSGYDTNAVFRDTILDTTYATGTPTEIDLREVFQLQIINFGGSNSEPTGTIGLHLEGGSNTNSYITVQDSFFVTLLSTASENTDITFINDVFEQGGDFNGSATFIQTSWNRAGLTLGDVATTNVVFNGSHVDAGNLTFGADAASVSGSLSNSPAIVGAPTTGQLITPAGVITYGNAVAFPNLLGIGVEAPLCADAAGNVYISTNNTGVGAPCVHP